MAIMAHQRSGSHFLGSAIGSCPEIKYVGEIFYCPPVDIQDVVDGIDRVAHGADVICVDTKYNQITPPLEEYLARPEVKVIHLIRRDRLAAYFSGALHTWRGGGHEGEEIPIFDFDLNIFIEIEEEVSRFRRQLGYLTNLQLRYEDLTGGGRDTTILPDWASKAICNLAGVDQGWPLVTPLGKEAPAHYLNYLDGVPLWLQNLIQEAYH